MDVSAEAFIEKAEAEGADLICMSALLTTTMPYMQTVIDALKEKVGETKVTEQLEALKEEVLESAAQKTSKLWMN